MSVPLGWRWWKTRGGSSLITSTTTLRTWLGEEPIITSEPLPAFPIGMLNIEKSSYEEQIWSHFFSSDEHPFQQKEEKYRLFVSRKGGRKYASSFKRPKRRLGCSIAAQNIMRQQCAFLGRDLSCLLCFVAVAQMFILYKRKQPLLISFFSTSLLGPWLSHLLLEGPPEAKSSPLHRFQHPAYHIQTQNIPGCPLHQHRGYLLVDRKPARTIQHSQRSSPKVERRMLRLKWQNSP